jgi:hypothetical protein
MALSLDVVLFLEMSCWKTPWVVDGIGFLMSLDGGCLARQGLDHTIAKLNI